MSDTVFGEGGKFKILFIRFSFLGFGELVWTLSNAILKDVYIGYFALNLLTPSVLPLSSSLGATSNTCPLDTAALKLELSSKDSSSPFCYIRFVIAMLFL